MTCITLDGRLGPLDSHRLDARLYPLTSRPRPHVAVDLSNAIELHPALVGVLARHQRTARRHAGDLAIHQPLDERARRTLDHIGLCDTIAARS